MPLWSHYKSYQIEIIGQFTKCSMLLMFNVRLTLMPVTPKAKPLNRA